MVKIMLILVSAALLVPNFIDKNINEKSTYDQKERFLPQLSYINSILKLEQHTDSVAAQQSVVQGSPEYFMLLERIVSERFYHGFSHYTLKENWIAAVGEKLAGTGLSCKVSPEDILQNQHAACSQQAIVMMEVARRKHADYRPVGFPHHYTLEIKCGNTWYYFDPNLEPDMSKTQRSALHWQTMAGSLKQYYNKNIQSSFDVQFGKELPFSGDINAVPAPRIEKFQAATAFLSKICWLFPLGILLVYTRRKKVRNNNVAVFSSLLPA